MTTSRKLESSCNHSAPCHSMIWYDSIRFDTCTFVIRTSCTITGIVQAIVPGTTTVPGLVRVLPQGTLFLVFRFFPIIHLSASPVVLRRAMDMSGSNGHLACTARRAGTSRIRFARDSGSIVPCILLTLASTWYSTVLVHTRYRSTIVIEYELVYTRYQYMWSTSTWYYQSSC